MMIEWRTIIWRPFGVATRHLAVWAGVDMLDDVLRASAA
jgi:hypothetical protein